MFHDLDATLLAILDDPAAPPLLRDADASFATPDKSFAPGQATVNLFLHEVQENRELRDPEPYFDLVDGQYLRRLPPMRVDCSYLVTTWSNESAGIKVAKEHELLGLTLDWLSRFPTIPASYLRGSLERQPYTLPTVVAQMDGVSGLGDFWTALGIAPRPAFRLVVTISMAIGIEHPAGREVISHRVDLKDRNGRGSESVFAIRGTIRSSASKGAVEGAQVTIEETSANARSDASGSFVFAGLAAGAYSLRIDAPGFAGASASIHVPAATAHAYDVELSPLA